MGFFDRISEGLSRSRDKFKESMNVLLALVGPDLDEEFWEGLEETLILSGMWAGRRPATSWRTCATKPPVRRCPTPMRCSTS